MRGINPDDPLEIFFRASDEKRKNLVECPMAREGRTMFDDRLERGPHAAAIFRTREMVLCRKTS